MTRLVFGICFLIQITTPILFLTDASATHLDRPVVRTVEGDLQGVKTDSVFAFKGIPYAKPPLGPNRWRPPQTVEKWSGVRDAQFFGSRCVQIENYGVGGKAIGSEDCLTLNIWTPN